MHKKAVGGRKETRLVPRLLSLAQIFNRFYLDGFAKKLCKPFLVEGHQVGLVRADFTEALVKYPGVFQIKSDSVVLNPAFRDYEQRSKEVEEVLQDLKKMDSLSALRGWRDEYYEIRPVFSSEPLLKMDRSATCMFGICKYGVDINGFVRDPSRGLCVWLQRRAHSKQTWPGKWDNMVGGGLSEGFGVLETAYKEAEEEAAIPQTLLSKLTPAGCVSFFYESDLGLFPNTEFVYDLELPLNFTPQNNDGEVETFQLLTTDELVELLFTADFKTTSCPVVVDFLIRHGVITPENEPDYPRLVELLHVPLQSIYKSREQVEKSTAVSNGKT